MKRFPFRYWPARAGLTAWNLLSAHKFSVHPFGKYRTIVRQICLPCIKNWRKTHAISRDLHMCIDKMSQRQSLVWRCKKKFSVFFKLKRKKFSRFDIILKCVKCWRYESLENVQKEIRNRNRLWRRRKW